MRQISSFLRHQPVVPGLITLTVALFMYGNAHAQDEKKKREPSRTTTDNPLLADSTLPYQMPPFDRIKDTHYGPAYERGFTEQLREAEEIARNPEEPTFENTIAAMERTGRTLDRVDRIFTNITSVNTNPAIKKLEKEIAPKKAAHQDTIRLNPELFRRIDTLYQKRDQLGLDPESAYLLERYHKDFVRAGARLSEADKERLKEINAELAKLSTEFSQNVLEEKNELAIVVDKKEELAGLPENEIAAAADAAKEAKKPGKYVLPLQNTTGQPSLASLQNRELRERIMQASLTRNSRGDKYDTRDIIKKMVELRAERAKLLGYETHAAYQIDDQTAGNVSTVNDMLKKVAPAAVANARKEAAEIQEMIKQEGGDFPVQPWDWDFYSEKVKKAKFDFEDAQLRPYFELDRVLRDGVFYAANKLYGITLKERNDLPTYLPEVRVFEVFDANEQPLALMLVDNYARDSKRGGAWMNAYVPQNELFGNKPVVGIHLNVPKPPKGEPTLMTYDEVETLFHEFGHALHGMFSNVKYPRFAGTSVPRDFVEFPSQVNEMWVLWPEVLKNYAKHYKTGEAMPQELVDKVIASEKFNEGYKTTEYLAATLLDQAWHQMGRDQVPQDVMAFEAEALREAGVDVPMVPPRYRSPYFSHVFSGGYSAGYYSYIWSEVLDANTVEWIKNNGGLTRENGDRFRRTLLSRGGSQEPLSLFREFTGGDPKIEPLLKRRGLDQAGATAPPSAP